MEKRFQDLDLAYAKKYEEIFNQVKENHKKLLKTDSTYADRYDDEGLWRKDRNDKRSPLSRSLKFKKYHAQIMESEAKKLFIGDFIKENQNTLTTLYYLTKIWQGQHESFKMTYWNRIEND